ncbi:hypothetical protein N9L18_00845 [Candidatus Pacebacteria bacterium]|nr:hypothetical protein [Candidatus Paceibacterota bacterium]
MDIAINIINILVSLFIGFTIGRYGDKWGGHWNVPHHWIYGLIFIFISLFLLDTWYGISLVSFGFGIFVSDLQDFVELKFYGADDPHDWKFWDID